MVKFSASLLLTRACFASQSHAVTTSIIGVFPYSPVCLMASVFAPHGVIQLNRRSFPHIAQINSRFSTQWSFNRASHSQSADQDSSYAPAQRLLRTVLPSRDRQVLVRFSV